MRLIKEVDPDGVQSRKGRRLRRRTYTSKVAIIICIPKLMITVLQLQGPNHIWHLDGYDKLSPYGLAIHGCVDG